MPAKKHCIVALTKNSKGSPRPQYLQGSGGGYFSFISKQRKYFLLILFKCQTYREQFYLGTDSTDA